MVEDIKWKQRAQMQPIKMKGNDRFGTCLAGGPAAEKRCSVTEKTEMLKKMFEERKKYKFNSLHKYEIM